MKKLFLTLLCVLCVSAVNAYGFYGDQATDRESFTLGISGQNANQVVSMTTLFPLQAVNGWAGLYASRQTADEMTVSETLNGHIQGGFKVGKHTSTPRATNGVRSTSHLRRATSSVQER